MYLEKAVARINNIEWEKTGTNSSEEIGQLGVEFLRRLADFYNTTSNKQFPPLFSDIAKFLGENSKIDFNQYYNTNTKEFLDKTIYQNKIFEYYLKLSKLADENPAARQYLNVYEPLIEILERGGLFKLRKNDLEIEHIISIPLNNCYDKFL